MKLNINNADSEREKNQKFAEEHNISQEEMDEIYNEIFEQLPEELTGERREARALRKTRNTLKKKVNISGTLVDGFILMRFRNNDFDKNAWNKVDNYVKENGIEKAREDGMVNADGEYLHSSLTTSFSNQHGQVIDKDNVRGSAVAIVAREEGEDVIEELRWLNIGKFVVNDKIPLCREATLVVKEGEKPGPLFNNNALFLNGIRNVSPNAYYSDEDFQAYGDMIESLCGDIAYYSKVEIDKHAFDNRNQRNDFIAVPVQSVSRLGNPLDNGSVPIDFELEDDQITAWADDYIFKDLTIEEGIQGILMLSTYIKIKKDTQEEVPGYRIGGFLPLL